ncbi:4-hydroxythreonine-4-phosphate dehydrogenase [Hasllibacter halocynthiae]|uniref:4-hydroxythreonine-4-phosphate dehydrogenase n=1 Tax=Hasllibacter halocynthiae TaxID=595589 RepID=A0A2T0X7P3_9RHOB|nr:4-hydroxythreonine-4-phosphate dehydrogenase PdxA [Hasllibacter halocynthiae]PRY94953.1 4-hydroxythreonine-4-phosphate dehydrogenase [Hasllibacter halocynthiae]
MSALPVAVSCGDPAGIGPELAVMAHRQLRAALPFAWIGDPRHLPEGANPQILSDMRDAPAAAARGLPVLPLGFPARRMPGRLDPRNAPATVAAIERAVLEVREARAAALCTLPIQKEALIEGADFRFPGHTEFLAHLTGADHEVMMLVGEGLRVVPATIHVPLADVPQALARTDLARTIRIAARSMVRDFGIERPRIAVAGLNPHAGEGGKIGREEIELIVPALETCRAEGLDVAGPLPGDTMFHPAARARYDVAVCMYHDQALIPVKTVDFAGGVNVTLGLRIVRTSPDHGTALDIAGTGEADPTSFVNALLLADGMARARGKA